MKNIYLTTMGVLQYVLYSKLDQCSTPVPPLTMKEKWKLFDVLRGFSNGTLTQYGLRQFDVNFYNNWQLYTVNIFDCLIYFIVF